MKLHKVVASNLDLYIKSVSFHGVGDLRFSIANRPEESVFLKEKKKLCSYQMCFLAVKYASLGVD